MFNTRFFTTYNAFMGLAIAIGITGCVSSAQDDEYAQHGEFEAEEPIGEAENAISYNGHDYLFVTSGTNWHTARSYCQSNGYDLVTISSSSEEDWLHQEEQRRGADSQWWIGYNDLGIEGTWLWANNEPPGYTHWSANEPNNSGNEDCAVDGWNVYDWNDANCGSTFWFICEKPSLSTSNTGTFNYSASNTAKATINTVNHTIQAFAGQIITVGTCGIAGASYSGDTWLRINGPGGNEIASLDDSCGGVGSNISLAATQSGAYTIRAGCYSNWSCSGTVAYKIGP